MNNSNYITPQTKVADLLINFPQLEDKLIELSPEFKRLKNPILRKTIAKIASLEQAASVAGISIDKMINSLRIEVGQNMEICTDTKQTNIEGKPDWFSESNIEKVFDARELIQSGQHPLNEVIMETKKLSDGKILEVITPFLPSPMLDIVKNNGLKVWTLKENESLYRNYFGKF